MATWLHNLHNQVRVNAHPTKQCEFVVIIAVGSPFMATWLHNLHNQVRTLQNRAHFVAIIAVGSPFMATASQPQNAAPHPARPSRPPAPNPPRLSVIHKVKILWDSSNYQLKVL